MNKISDIRKIAELLHQCDPAIIESILQIVTVAAGKQLTIKSEDISDNRRLTIKEAAERCRMSPGALYNLINMRRGPIAFKSGHRVFIQIKDIEHWLLIRETKILPNGH